MKNPQKKRKEFCKRTLKELKNLPSLKIEFNLSRGGAVW